VRRADLINSAVIPVRPSLRDAGLWFIALTLAVTTLLHYLTDIRLIPSHSIYRSLYYVPIAVAAVRYGRRGGILTALTASLFHIPHVILSWGVMRDDGINDLLKNVVFLFVGAFAGTLADAERTQRQRAQAASEQLAAANTALQAQVAIAEQMRASMASILESIDSGVLTLDNDRQVMTINRAAQALLDWLTRISVVYCFLTSWLSRPFADLAVRQQMIGAYAFLMKRVLHFVVCLFFNHLFHQRLLRCSFVLCCPIPPISDSNTSASIQTTFS
jgi:PAS domain-containing protein